MFIKHLPTSFICIIECLGARVVLWDARKTENAIVADEINNGGGTAFAYCCDLLDKDDIERKAMQMEQDVGKPTVVINNAGILKSKTFLQLSEQDVRDVFEVNTLSHFWVSYLNY